MYTLDQVVREYLIERGDTAMNSYKAALQCAIVILREMHYDVSGDPSFAFIEVTSLGTAPLPVDYVSYVAIGVADAAGNFVPLGLNDSMLPPLTADDCGNPQRPVGSVPVVNEINGGYGYGNYYGNYRNGEYMGGAFGIGGGNNIHGYYKVMEKNGYISLQNVTASHIVLVYIANPEKSTGNFLVHAFDVEPIKHGIYWRMLSFNTKVSGGEKERAEALYLRKKRHSKARHNPFRIDEIKQVLRQFNQATPKL